MHQNNSNHHYQQLTPNMPSSIVEVSAHKMELWTVSDWTAKWATFVSIDCLLIPLVKHNFYSISFNKCAKLAVWQNDIQDEELDSIMTESALLRIIWSFWKTCDLGENMHSYIGDHWQHSFKAVAFENSLIHFSKSSN